MSDDTPDAADRLADETGRDREVFAADDAPLPEVDELESVSDDNPYVVGPTPRDESTLRRLYCEQKLTVAAMARKLNRNPSTVYNWMDEFGIERRGRGNDRPRTNGGDSDE